MRYLSCILYKAVPPDPAATGVGRRHAHTHLHLAAAATLSCAATCRSVSVTVRDRASTSSTPRTCPSPHPAPSCAASLVVSLTLPHGQGHARSLARPHCAPLSVPRATHSQCHRPRSPLVWLSRVPVRRCAVPHRSRREKGSQAAHVLAHLVRLARRHPLHAARAHAVTDGVLILRVLALRAQALVEVLLRKELVAGLAVPALLLVLATLRAREGSNDERRSLCVIVCTLLASPPRHTCRTHTCRTQGASLTCRTQTWPRQRTQDGSWAPSSSSS